MNKPNKTKPNLKRPAMGMPPKKQIPAAPEMAVPDEEKVRGFISKGGSPAAEPLAMPEPEPDAMPAAKQPAVKQINVKLLAPEVERINELRERRPRPRSGRKLGISLHDWIVEAVQEKIERDNAKPA